MEDIFSFPKAKAPVILSYEDLIVVGLPVIQTGISRILSKHIINHTKFSF